MCVCHSLLRPSHSPSAAFKLVLPHTFSVNLLKSPASFSSHLGLFLLLPTFLLFNSSNFQFCLHLQFLQSLRLHHGTSTLAAIKKDPG